MRRLRANEVPAHGLDVLPSPFTDQVGSITDPPTVNSALADVTHVFHCATLHKPHVVTHSKADFLGVNVHGTLNLLTASAASAIESFVFTSTTSVFGDALRPAPGEPAAWITELTRPLVKNIYGATKLAAEDLCQVFHREHGLNTVVLRTSRFYPEDDDSADNRAAYTAANLKLNELLYRRLDIEDAVEAHLLAAQIGRFESATV